MNSEMISTTHPSRKTDDQAATQNSQPSTSPASARDVRVYSAFADLPAPCVRLLDELGQQNFFLTHAWFQNFSKTALDSGDSIRIYAISPPERPEVAAAMIVARSAPQNKKNTALRKLTALTNYYSCFYAPHIAGSGRNAAEALAALTRAMAAEKPSWDAIEMQPLDVNAENFPALVKALRAAGFVVQTFFCFGNWYLPVEHRTFGQYMDSLPSVLRNTLNRKRKKLEKSGRAKIEIITGGEGLEAAIQAYTTVYQASWKRPEPYQDFMPGLIRTCAEMGALRLGLIHIDGEPAAVQLWIVHNGAALIYKLAYDERFAETSAGTILTATLMQYVLDVDKVNEVDYLSGDDAYKKDWMSHRRERWGVLAMNPRTVRGALAIARHVCGRAVKRNASWILRRLRRGAQPASA
jgi:hypothetical protein